MLLLQEMEEAWSKKYQEFRQHWAHLSAAIKGSAIEPIEVDCTAKLEEVQHNAVVDVEGRQHLSYYTPYSSVAVAFVLICVHSFPCMSTLKSSLELTHFGYD